MKTWKLVLCSLLMVAVTLPAISQQKTSKLNRELKARVEKDSRKTAKKLVKEGWMVMPGKLPLAKMVQESRWAEIDTDKDTGEKLYFTGTHQAKGGNYTAAKQIADNRARLELAQAISTKVSQIIEDKIVSTDFGDNDLSALTDFISSNKTVVAATLRGVDAPLEIYRIDPKTGDYEVMVFLIINAERALKDARQAYVNALRQQSESLAEELNEVLEGI